MDTLEISLFLRVLFVLSSAVSIALYFRLAFTNPGFIMGSGADVEKRAGAYNPKHYQVESDKKAKPQQDKTETFKDADHKRKLSFLTSKLTAKSKPGGRQMIKHVELPALSDQPNNQIMSTNSGLDDVS